MSPIRRHRPLSEGEVTIDDVQQALIVAARLVDLYGEKCLPIFERLERELAEMLRRSSALDRARQIARASALPRRESLGRQIGNLA